jgi:hypothetical protein
MSTPILLFIGASSANPGRSAMCIVGLRGTKANEKTAVLDNAGYEQTVWLAMVMALDLVDGKNDVPIEIVVPIVSALDILDDTRSNHPWVINARGVLARARRAHGEAAPVNVRRPRSTEREWMERAQNSAWQAAFPA